MKESIPMPTEAELEILRVLWRRGQSTVRQVHEDLDGNVGYTTILKLMQIMTEKGLVVRDERERAHIYSPSMTEDTTQSQLVGHLMNRAFDGSSSKLVMQALSSRPSSREELAQIRQLLESLEGGVK